MSYVDLLVKQVRRETENNESSAFTGIGDIEFIQYLNDAQYHLQAIITSQHPRVFVDETVVDIVKDQERYDLPDDILLENKIHSVEYSSDGKSYYNLSQTNMKNRSDTTETGYPNNYIRLSGQLLLTPLPSSSGKIRINYVRRVKELGLRKAYVQIDTTLNSSGNVQLSLNNSKMTTDIQSLLDAEYICIVNRYGKVKLSNIPIAYANNTNIATSSSVTLDMLNYSPKDSDLAKADLTVKEGDYIVAGKDTTTHSEFPKSVERYLLSYASWKILKRDSSQDSTEMQGELTMMANEITKSYAHITDDLQYIPEINEEDWSF